MGPGRQVLLFQVLVGSDDEVKVLVGASSSACFGYVVLYLGVKDLRSNVYRTSKSEHMHTGNTGLDVYTSRVIQ